MKFLCFSDLHLELRSAPLLFIEELLSKTTHRDNLILAGDVGNVVNVNRRKELIECLTMLKSYFDKIFWVPGNHEYYGCNKMKFDDATQIMRNISEKIGIIFLEKDVYESDDFRVVGTTLWSNTDKHTFKSINDSKFIFKSHSEYNLQYKSSLQWLCEVFSKENSKPSVVITHHLPTFEMIHPRYEGNINNCFATEIIDLFPLENIKLWVCGHTHEGKILDKEGCKIVCNPIGYIGEQKMTRVIYDEFEV